jgi:ribose-phosphate pyrophosphokinase
MVTKIKTFTKVLNLVDLEKSEIKYKISNFPDGQQQLQFEGTQIGLIKGYLNPNIDYQILIKSRLNNFEDLELICCAVASLRELNIEKIHLYTPYFLGSRSDRKFGEGSNNYLKSVICPIINSLNFKSVTVMDPHSDVLEACLNNFNKIDNFALVDDALSYMIGDDEEDQIVLVSPDAGAYKKVFDVAKEFDIEKIITATKVRDLKTGQILHTEVPVLDQHNDLKYVIVDDICDGGRTFIEIAKAIKASRPTAKIYLVVTHGIFSAGFAQLGEYFEQIFTTNSVKNVVKDSEDTDAEIQAKQIVTQFNVF